MIGAVSRARGAALQAMLAPSSIAVIGASTAPDKAGHAMLRSLATFPGPVHAVNPRADVATIAGRPVAARAADIAGGVDLAIACVPAGAVAGAVADAAAAGAAGCVVCAGGFGEAGAAGLALQAQAADIAASAGMRLLGPNTSGFLVPARRLVASFVPDATSIEAGPVAVVAQSGGVCHATAFALGAAGVGVSVAIGLGNAVDVDAADAVEAAAAAEGTRAIALHLEGVRDGRRLIAAVERAVARVPVVALKVGRTDVGGFAASHTGAMLGSYELARAALARAGAVLVDDLDELVDAVSALATLRLPPGATGVAVVTGQAGPGLLLADGLRAHDVAMPPLADETRARLTQLLPPITYQENPVDTGRPAATFGDVVAAVAADPAIGLTCVYALHEPPALDPLQLRSAARGAPIVFVTDGPRAAVDATAGALRGAGVPTCVGTAAGVRAVRALMADAGRRLPAPPPAPPPAPDDGTSLAPLAGDEAATKRLLAARGLAVPDGVVCQGRKAAWKGFAAAPGPVVVKTADPAISHKSDVGGVHVGVADPPSLERALDAIDRASPTQRYLVEEVVADGVDLIVGAVRDPAFGPTVLIGLGGVAAEVLDDVATRPAPVGVQDVAAMVRELRGWPLLAGFRGGRPVDVDALARAVVTIADVLVAHPEVDELEVNPLRMTPAGPVVVDALLVAAAR